MSPPGPPSHFLPRTRTGRVTTVTFLLLFALCMPPVTHTVLNRIEPVMLGVPFIWLSLLVVYVLLIGVLIRAYRSGV